MRLLGFSLNTLSLFGLVLAIAIVVDDAIVVVEDCQRIVDERKLSPRQAAISATLGRARHTNRHNRAPPSQPPSSSP